MKLLGTVIAEFVVVYAPNRGRLLKGRKATANVPTLEAMRIATTSKQFLPEFAFRGKAPQASPVNETTVLSSPQRLRVCSVRFFQIVRPRSQTRRG
jgi:hypothetical protein